MYIDGQAKVYVNADEGYEYKNWSDEKGSITEYQVKGDSALKVSFAAKAYRTYFTSVDESLGTTSLTSYEIPYGSPYNVLQESTGGHPVGSLQFETNSGFVYVDPTNLSPTVKSVYWTLNGRTVTSGIYEGEPEFVLNFNLQPIETINVIISPQLTDGTPGGGSVDKVYLENVPVGSQYIGIGNVLVVNGTQITATPLSEEYIFKGWKYGTEFISDGGGQIVASIKDFHPVYELKTYKLTFQTDSMKGSVSNSNGTVSEVSGIKAGTRFVISGNKIYVGNSASQIYTANSVIPKNYTFKEWEGYGIAYDGYVYDNLIFSAVFDTKIYTLTFNGESYMDIYDVESSTKAPMDSFSAQVEAGTSFDDGSGQDVPAVEKLFNILTAHNYAPGEAIKFLDVDGKSHTIIAKPKYEYENILHFSSWVTNPKRSSGENITENITFTPEIARDMMQVDIVMASDSSDYAQIFYGGM